MEGTAKHIAAVELTADDYFTESNLLQHTVFEISLMVVSEKVKDFLEAHANFGCIVFTTVEKEELLGFKSFDFTMEINAYDMIQFCRKVFCPQDEDVAAALSEIYEAVSSIDEHIGPHLVSDCMYRNGVCTRKEPCGRSIEVLKRLISVVPERYYRDARNEEIARSVGKDVN